MQMLRLLLQPSSHLSPLRLLHHNISKTLTPSLSDATISYLKSSCGLPHASALSISKKLTLKTTDSANSFLSLLKDYSFSQSQISRVVSAHPELLTYDSRKKTRPKLEFFLQAGYSKSYIASIVTNNPQILCVSLENRLRPNFDVLKTILSTNTEFSVAISNSSHLLALRLQGAILPNMKTLWDVGVPRHNVMKLVTCYPKALTKRASNFDKDVDLLKKMGFDVRHSMFIVGMNALSMLAENSWEKKLELYKRFGWSEEVTFRACRRYPYCMSLSEGKIKRHMKFFVEKLKFEPSYVAKRPNFLAYSFEKRILPRYKIFSLLESKGLPLRTRDFVSFLYIPEKEFLNRYIIKYLDRVPEVLKFYGDKLELFRCKEYQ